MPEYECKLCNYKTKIRNPNNDGINDGLDAFPLNPWETADFDGDGVGNSEDNDDDNDGVMDNFDAFPFNPNDSRLDSNDSTNSIITELLVTSVIILLLTCIILMFFITKDRNNT